MSERPSAIRSPCVGIAELFSIAWALALLFHQNARGLTATEPVGLALTLSAFILLAVPTSAAALLLTAAMQLLEWGLRLPWVSNHWMLTAAMSLVLLQSAAALRIQRRRMSVEALFELSAPAGRLLLTVLYFYAVLHKLNTDFLNPESSCARVHAGRLAGAFGLPDVLPLHWFAIVGTLVVEAAIPVLLWWKRGRRLGLALGIGLHAIIALDPGETFYNFSSIVYAFYLCFVSLEEERPGLSLPKDRRIDLALRTVPVVVLAFLLSHPSWVRWTFIGYVLLYAAAVFRVQASEAAPTLAVPRPAFWAIPVLIFINGSSPYLGLKTETSFAMFSNLRTEGGRTNSLIVPAAVRLLDLQDDLIGVLDSSDPWLQATGQNHQLFTRFELRSYLSQHPAVSLTITDAKGTHTLDRADRDPELVRPVSWLERKLLFFRLVDAGDHARCSH